MDATESNFLPKNDSNVVEYKLSSEELLERIEHYLRGDVLKRRLNRDGEEETFYSLPTKKISVTLFRDNTSGRVYVVDEHHKEPNSEEETWELLSIFEKDDEVGVVFTDIVELIQKLNERTQNEEE